VAAVVGVDVSPDMLAEARRNCDLHGLANVELLPSDDTLSAVTGSFDLVHSCITFQHIDVPRGRRLFARLIELLADNGIGAIQITYAKAYHPDSHGQPPAPPPPPAPTTKIEGRAPALIRAVLGENPAPPADPEMLMNPYNLSELAFMLQSAGVASFSVEFTDHGGELGVFLFFRKPAR
jgi:SAM-dependent methyltransferase